MGFGADSIYVYITQQKAPLQNLLTKFMDSFIVLMHIIAPNLVGNLHILRKYVNLTLMLIGQQMTP